METPAVPDLSGLLLPRGRTGGPAAGAAGHAIPTVVQLLLGEELATPPPTSARLAVAWSDPARLGRTWRGASFRQSQSRRHRADLRDTDHRIRRTVTCADGGNRRTGKFRLGGDLASPSLDELRSPRVT